MNITQETVNDFVVGHGGADAASKPIVVAGFARMAYKGVRVRAASANTIVVFVGPQGVETTTGYPLPAGEELAIPIENPSKVYIVAVPTDNCEQTVALAGQTTGDTFTLTFGGETTAAIAVTANAATVQATLQALSAVGDGNCSVTDTGGGPPYTVEFISALAKQDVVLMTGSGTGGCTVTVTKLADITSGSKYSWIAV